MQGFRGAMPPSPYQDDESADFGEDDSDTRNVDSGGGVEGRGETDENTEFENWGDDVGEAERGEADGSEEIDDWSEAFRAEEDELLDETQDEDWGEGQQAALEAYAKRRESREPQTMQEIYDELDGKSDTEKTFSLPEIREDLRAYASGETDNFFLDVYDYVNSLDDSTKVMVIDEIAAAVPNFEPKEFLALLAREDPIMMVRFANGYVESEAAPSIGEIETSLRQKFLENMRKYPKNADWREYCWLNYESLVDDLTEVYQRDGKLSDAEEAEIEEAKHEFFQDYLEEETKALRRGSDSGEGGVEREKAVEGAGETSDEKTEGVTDEEADDETDEETDEETGGEFDEVPEEEILEDVNLMDLVMLFPHVYDTVSQEETYSMVKDTLKNISVDSMREMLERRKQGDFVGSDKMLVDILREAFGIEHEIDVKYLEPKEGPAVGYYIEAENSLYVVRNTDRGVGENDIMKTIAHEMCHAYQYDQMRAGTKRGKEYDLNYDWYIRYENSADYYFSQKVELEAYTFEEYFGKMVRVIEKNAKQDAQE